MTTIIKPHNRPAVPPSVKEVDKVVTNTSHVAISLHGVSTWSCVILLRVQQYLRASKAKDGQELEVSSKLLYSAQLAHVFAICGGTLPFLRDRCFREFVRISIVVVRSANLFGNNLGLYRRTGI